MNQARQLTVGRARKELQRPMPHAHQEIRAKYAYTYILAIACVYSQKKHYLMVLEQEYILSFPFFSRNDQFRIDHFVTEKYNLTLTNLVVVTPIGNLCYYK